MGGLVHAVAAAQAYAIGQAICSLVRCMPHHVSSSGHHPGAPHVLYPLLQDLRRRGWLLRLWASRVRSTFSDIQGILG